MSPGEMYARRSGRLLATVIGSKISLDTIERLVAAKETDLAREWIGYMRADFEREIERARREDDEIVAGTSDCRTAPISAMILLGCVFLAGAAFLQWSGA